MRIGTLSVLLVAALGLLHPPVMAADDCGAARCARCGCHDPCLQKVCQLVCEIKKETKTYWCVECQEMCPLLPGCHHGCECPPLPHCGHPKTIKKLVKKEYQVDVPVYKCIVRYLCPSCSSVVSPARTEAAPGPPTGAPTLAPPPAPTPTPLPPPPANVQ